MTNTITLDGATVELIEDPHGWHARLGDSLVYVTRVLTSVAVSPAKARMAPAR